MADKDLDYHIDEDLEHLFHSDLQNLVLEQGETSHEDVIGDHLPEWLVGVIVVIAMLAVAFFVMVVTSLLKNRKKQRNSAYTGAGSHTTCDDLESGKLDHSDDHSMKMTSFTSVTDTLTECSSPTQSVVDASDHDNLTSGGVGLGIQGCKNPLFVDDSDDNSSEGKEKTDGGDEAKEKTKKGERNSPPTSSGGSSGETIGKSKSSSHKYKSSNSKKSVTSTKSVPSTKSEQADDDKPHESPGEGKKRMFASKAKGGSHTSSKRDKTNATVLGDSAHRSGERRESAASGQAISGDSAHRSVERRESESSGLVSSGDSSHKSGERRESATSGLASSGDLANRSGERRESATSGLASSGDLANRSGERRESAVSGLASSGDSAQSNISTALNVLDESNACCDDSGVELSCQEGRLKEETGGGSESDEAGSRLSSSEPPDNRQEANSSHGEESAKSQIALDIPKHPPVLTSSPSTDCAVVCLQGEEKKAETCFTNLHSDDPCTDPACRAPPGLTELTSGPPTDTETSRKLSNTQNCQDQVDADRLLSTNL